MSTFPFVRKRIEEERRRIAPQGEAVCQVKRRGNPAGTWGGSRLGHWPAMVRPPAPETLAKSGLVAEARLRGVGKKPDQKPGRPADFTVTKATVTRSPGQWLSLGMLKV